MAGCKVLNWGILGCGLISEDFCNVLNQYSNKHKVTAVAARDEKRAADFAARHGNPLSYDDYDNLIAEDQVEVIYIGTVHTTHMDLCIKACNAGKHVVCEKPMGVNAAEVKAMVKAARTNGVFLLEAFWSRFFPTYTRLREDVLNGSCIGQPDMVTISFCKALHRATTPARVFDKATAWGVTLDMGCYTVQLAQWVLGADGARPKVHAVGRIDKETGVDHAATVLLEYHGGRFANLSYAFDRQSGPMDAYVSGPMGSIRVHEPMNSPLKLTVKGVDVSFPLPGRTPKQPYFFDPAEREGFCYIIGCVHECITAGQKECSTMPLDESILVAEILDEIRSQIGMVYPQD